MENKNILPVLLGADLNCYSVARAFNEQYGVKSKAFGKYRIGVTSNSKIIDFEENKNISDENFLINKLLSFAEENKDSELYLIGCTDEYAELIINNKDKLKDKYFISCPEKELSKKIISKDNFYNMCEERGIPYPKNYIFEKTNDFSELEEKNLGFSYPIIIKPSSSIEYWHHEFEGMKKVYTAENAKEAKDIISAIFSSGYDKSIILQDLIPGGEDTMYVLTAYSDKNAKVRMASLGHVLLGEHTPKGLGNHVAIITEYHKDITDKLIKFLEDINYTGFSNFDIKFDPRDGSFRVLEINLRQGRSNYYVTSSGINIASMLVKDNRNEFKDKINICKNEFFWHTVPKKIIYRYIKDKNIKSKVQKLVSEGKSASSLFYKYDMRLNPSRSAFVFIHNQRYFKKYKIYK